MYLEVVLPDLADGSNKESEGKRRARDDVKLNKGKKTPLVKTRGTINGKLGSGNKSSALDVLSVQCLSDIRAGIMCRPRERELKFRGEINVVGVRN